jgi:hypothetical protein
MEIGGVEQILQGRLSKAKLPFYKFITYILVFLATGAIPTRSFQKGFFGPINKIAYCLWIILVSQKCQN